MTKELSDTVWQLAIDRAWAGEPRNLVELLISPTQSDNSVQPLPGGFSALPDDHDLRVRIVECLVRGPWIGKDATALDLMTRTFLPGRKPALSDLEVSFAELRQNFGATADDMAGHAEGLGVKPDSLGKRIGARRRKGR